MNSVRDAREGGLDSEMKDESDMGTTGYEVEAVKPR